MANFLYDVIKRLNAPLVDLDVGHRGTYELANSRVSTFFEMGQERLEVGILYEPLEGV